ncbi:MAG TPA: VWA domain-containing protein [Candidatus Acidoferrales bacterium]|jgi:Ca-activated chloride channel family protein
MRIKHIFICAIVCLTGAASAFAQSIPPPPPPELPMPSTQTPLRVNVNLVMVDATVKSKDGQIIGDLKKDDFEVLEDGVAQKLEVFSQDELPLNVAIVLDLSDSMEPYLGPLRNTMTSALSALKPQDQVSLFTFSTTAQLRVFLTDDKTRIARYISTTPAGGATNINDGIFVAAKYLFNAHPTGRRVIILISDDVATNRGHEGTPEIITEALEADAALYNLTVPGFNAASSILAAHRASVFVDIKRTMNETGGENFDVKDVMQLDTAFRELIQRIKTRYTMGYYPRTSVPSDKPHKLEVRLAPSFGKKGRDYIVVAKSGFYVH